jgi:hypothetical protein
LIFEFLRTPVKGSNPVVWFFLRTSLATKGQNRFFDFVDSPVKQYIYPEITRRFQVPEKEEEETRG